MPELPEVEHARLSLRRWLSRGRIERAEADATRIFRGSDRRAFERALAGRRLVSIERRGKYLALAFDRDVGLLAHLGMSGKWVRRRPGDRAPRHSRARLLLAGGDVIHYDDPRMFGRIELVRASELAGHPTLRALGPDPLHEGIDPAALGARLGRSARAVKVALLDQALLAGVGNILATEALFRAGVHPGRPARSLSPAEIAGIARGIDAAIAHSLADLRGEVEIDYLSSGVGAENPFLVYDRAGQPCPRCGRALVREVIGGRSSAHCPRCQPERRVRARGPAPGAGR